MLSFCERAKVYHIQENWNGNFSMKKLGIFWLCFENFEIFNCLDCLSTENQCPKHKVKKNSPQQIYIFLRNVGGLSFLGYLATFFIGFHIFVTFTWDCHHHGEWKNPRIFISSFKGHYRNTSVKVGWEKISEAFCVTWYVILLLKDTFDNLHR